MQQRVETFEDVHVHAAAIGAWNQTYTQISPGPLQSSLMQIAGSRCHVFRERINQRVVQQGEAPKNQACFALPIDVPGSAHMQGRKVDDKSLFFLRGGEEFMFHMPMGMDMLAITFDQSLFEECLNSLPQAAKIACLLKQPVIKVSPERFLQCRHRVIALFTDALAASPLRASPDGERLLEIALLHELLQLLADPECDATQRQTSSTHSYIVEKLHRLIVSDAMNVPSIFEASRRLHSSRRTVQNSFRAVADTTPLNYLRSVRLNGVRRDLMSTRASDASIADIASRWGFFHMSHFAEDYQALFNELPSQTPRIMPGESLSS